MHGIIVAAGTKDKMDPSKSATTNCQLRIRSSRQACLNKPVNMALLTPRNGAPIRQNVVFYSFPGDRELILHR